MALERLFEAQSETLVQKLAHDDYCFQCGTLTALRVIAGLPESLSQSMRLHDERTRSARVPDDPTGSVGFLNTPWFHGWRADAERGTGTSAVAGT